MRKVTNGQAEAPASLAPGVSTRRKKERDKEKRKGKGWSSGA